MRDSLIVVAVIALIVFGPLASIWAVNTLFGFAIAYTFWNWLIAVVLISFFVWLIIPFFNQTYG